MTKELFDAIKGNEIIKRYELDKEIKEIIDGKGLINIDSYDYIDLLKDKKIVAVINNTFDFGEKVQIEYLSDEKPTMGILYLKANSNLTIAHLDQINKYIVEKLGEECNVISAAAIDKTLPDNRIKMVLICTK